MGLCLFVFYYPYFKGRWGNWGKEKNTLLTYSRLINHLRASISRMEERKHITNPLLDTIKEQFGESYGIATKLGKYIHKTKDVHVSDDELGYLALHIERIK